MAGLFRMRKITLEQTGNGWLCRWWEREAAGMAERALHFACIADVAFQFDEPTQEARETPPAPELTPEQEVRLQRIEATADSVGDEVPGPMCRTAAQALHDSVNRPDCE